jgi:hypothetical protein
MNELNIELNENEKFETHSSYLKSKIKKVDDESNLQVLEKDLLRPLKNSDKNIYKKEDLIRVHEFRKENIREPYKEIEDIDYFQFTNEDDPKYRFSNVQYQVRSKLFIKSIIWSFGIGCMFFAHRYYRRQQFLNAMRWGASSWTLGMFTIWGSLELQPFLMGQYHSNFLRELSKKEELKYKLIGNYKQEEEIGKKYFKLFGLNLKIEESDNCGISKWSFDYDSIILKKFNYNPLATEKIYKKKEISDDDLFNEDFDETEITNSLIEDDIIYDFSFHKKLVLGKNCIVSLDTFLDREKNKLSLDKLKLLKNDVLSNKNLFYNNTVDQIKKELMNCEKFLDGKLEDYESDPDYKNY